jgi:hypothetical protein
MHLCSPNDAVLICNTAISRTFFFLLRPLILRQTRCRARSSGGVYNCRDENAYGTKGGGGSGSSHGGGIVPKVCKYIQ